MKTLNAFLNDIFVKANIPADDKALVDLLASSELQKINIPDELLTGVENNLISVEQAKNNHPIIKSHYNGETYNGLNAEIDRVANDLQLPDNVKLAIANEKLATKRIGVLAQKLVEVERAKKNTNDKGEMQSLQKTIDDLQAEIAAEKDAKKRLETEYSTKEKNLYLQSEINELFGEYKTIFDGLPKKARNAALNALLTQTLQDKNAKLVFDDDQKLKLVRNDGANVFGDDNRPWNVKTMLDHTLAANKALVVSGSGTTGDGKDKTPNNGKSTQQNTVIEGGNNNGKNNNQNGASSVLSNAIDQSLKDLEEADKVLL